MAQKNRFDIKAEIGRELASVTSSYRDWPADVISEAGLCQLRDSRGREQRLNRHYAVSGPSLFDIERSFRSRKLGEAKALYAMMTFIEYGQYEGSECVMTLSHLKAQIEVEYLHGCSEGRYVGQSPQRYLKLRGRVHQICGVKLSPIFCSNRQCHAAIGEPTDGMYCCAMTAAPQVVEAGDRVEILYDAQTNAGRILGVARLGSMRVELYNFVPAKFVATGGFANVTLDVIRVRTH